MSKKLQERCTLCGKVLRYAAINKRAARAGFPVGAQTHDHDAKSEMHYAHTRSSKKSRAQFNNLPDIAWKRMGVKNPQGTELCCYECHEVVSHNPVLSEDNIKQLATHFEGKSFEEKVIIFNQLLSLGLALKRTGR
ncbi:MAG: hypothetical protein ACYTHJ_22170 [Planctomycetota bacterium]|jgi:hypothetical protein